MSRLLTVFFLSFSLFACATVNSPRVNSELQMGKRYFEAGYYRKALHQLLPLACDGNPEAQYAIGYMYYYGYGVAQDTDTGYFWIQRAASKQYLPAVQALRIIRDDQREKYTDKQLLY